MSQAAPAEPTYGWRTPVIVLIAGCVIAAVGFGIRSSFGLFLDPMTSARGWDRETFALAMAIQNLLWGAGLPIAGALADRYGPSRVLMTGGIMYFAGVWWMAHAESAFALHMSGGFLTGLGVSFTAFSIALAAMARVVGPDKRSLALGLGTAAGSFGQVVFSPLGQAFISSFGWQDALLILAVTSLAIIPLAFMLPGGGASKVNEGPDQSIRQAVNEALAHRGYVLLTIGFFVCGFHVAFITVHFPAYVSDLGLPVQVGAYALALVGLFNIAGSLMAGAFGQRWSKKMGLSGIYFVRAIVIAALLLAPKTEITIYLFAAAMGILWLSTVPLTTGIVGQVFGVRYLATLFGVVFFSHQLGSFAGIWLGGYLYDTMGTYDPVWWAGIALGLLAAAIHLPIDEQPLARLAPAR